MSTTMLDDNVVTGSGSIPSDALRALPAVTGIPHDDDLAIHIARLQSLHPGLVRFRMCDVAAMDDATKRMLIQDINAVLGIDQF